MNPEFKSVLTEIKSGIEKFGPRLDSMQAQLDAIDANNQRHFPGGSDEKSLADVLTENEDLSRLKRDRRGRAVISFAGKDCGLLQTKTTITSGVGGTVGSAVSGVMPIGRLANITAEARQQLTIRDLLSATPTTFQIIDFVRVNQPMTIASPVAEASLKPENAVGFTSVSERVRTIATWIPASRQVLEDVTGLASFINTSLAYYVDQEEELQLLSGDGTAENLHGLIPQASAFSTGLLSISKGWNKIDIVGRAVQQITVAKELQPTFLCLHPADWWDMRLTKDGFGRYILGDPSQPYLSQNIFGLAVNPTTNLAPGTFLIGSGSAVASQIQDRMEMQIDISTEHSDFFVRNLIAVRAEKRLALITRRPGSYMAGSFNTSPA